MVRMLIDLGAQGPSSRKVRNKKYKPNARPRPVCKKDKKYKKCCGQNQKKKYDIEALPFWIPPGRSITWEMGGSQFTMTLCTGLSQTTKNDNGNGSHSRFSGFGTIPCTGTW